MYLPTFRFTEIPTGATVSLEDRNAKIASQSWTPGQASIT